MGATRRVKPRDGRLPMGQAEMRGNGCLPKLEVGAPEQHGLNIPCRGGDKSGIPHHSVASVDRVPAVVGSDDWYDGPVG